MGLHPMRAFPLGCQDSRLAMVVAVPQDTLGVQNGVLSAPLAVNGTPSHPSELLILLLAGPG